VIRLQRDDGDLLGVLFWLAFFLVPLIARGIQAIRKSQEAKARAPGGGTSVPSSPRERIDDLEREGEDAWKRLLEAEEEGPPVAEPVPVPRLEASAPPRPISLEDLGRGLEGEVREVSLEAEGPATLAAETLVPELQPVAAGEEALASIETFDSPAAMGQDLLAPALAGGVEKPSSKPRVPVVAGRWNWRTGFLAGEILGPPLSLRRRTGDLGEPSSAFGGPGSG